MDIISRLKLFMETFSITNSQLADAAGIPRPTISQLLNGRNKSNEGAKKVSSDILRKIHDAFPILNMMWLIFGDGEMVANGNIEFSEPQNFSYEPHFYRESPEDEPFQKHIDFESPSTNFSQDSYRTEKSAQSISPNTPQASAETNRANNIAAHTALGLNQPSPKQNDKAKRVESIMVFYSDNSFEIFKPSPTINIDNGTANL